MRIVTPKLSGWWLDYIENPEPDCPSWNKGFRQRLRLSYWSFVGILEWVSGDGCDGLFDRWRTEADGYTGRKNNKKVSPSIELLLLGALRYLGRGWTYHVWSNQVYIYTRPWKFFCFLCWQVSILFRCFLNKWQVRHVLQNVWTWLHKFGHVHVCRIVASVRDLPRCTRYSWYQATTHCWSCTRMYIFPWYVMTSTFSSFVVLKLSFVLLIHFCLSVCPVLDTLQLVLDLVENLFPLHLLSLRRCI